MLLGAERFSAQKTSPTWGGVWKCAVLNTENVIFTEFLLCSGVLAAAGPLNMASATGFFQVSCNKRHNALKEGHDGLSQLSVQPLSFSAAKGVLSPAGSF